MMVNKNRNAAIFAPVIFTLLVAAAAIDVSAQAERRRVAKRPTPTPVPISREPAIISRADDFPIAVVGATPVPAEPVEGSGGETIEELRERILLLEGRNKRDPDERQRRLSLNLDILTKSEQRSDTLRKQLFEMIEKENTIRGRMDQIENDIRPESIDRTMATVGSLRPEELRAQRRRSLELERNNLQTLLTEIQKNRSNLEQNLVRSDALVERLRVRIEKEIDEALLEGEKDPPAEQ